MAELNLKQASVFDPRQPAKKQVCRGSCLNHQAASSSIRQVAAGFVPRQRNSSTRESGSEADDRRGFHIVSQTK
jgi:hypothetical protein